MSIRMKDIAKELNLSVASVSMALNDKSGINDETKQLVIETAKKMGYTLNRVAKNLSDRKSRCIGIIVPDIVNPYYGSILKLTSEYIDNYYHYSTVFATSNDDPNREERIIEEYISDRLDGIIIAPTHRNMVNHSYYQKLHQYNIKYAFISAYYTDVKAPYVMVDLEEGSYQLVRYLLDLGHRKILFLTSDPSLIPSSTRINGYVKAFNDRKIPVDRSLLINCLVASFDNAYRTTIELFRQNNSFDAIITINDIMALGVLKALNEMDLKVPNDISVAGFDNLIFSSISMIPLTTVNQDIEKMGKNCVDMLFGMIQSNNGTDNNQILIEPELIIRRSTAKNRRTIV